VYVCQTLLEHRNYLADSVRLSAYDKAIGAVVKPGDVVLDLGSGTGILGLFACRAGARHVYSVESSSLIGLARKICEANGFVDRVTFLRGFSTELELPEKVDVVLADQTGEFGFNSGGLLRSFRDARRRLLKGDGKLVPSSIELFAAPVECPDIFQQVDFWHSSRAELDFSPVHSTAANTTYFVDVQGEQVLATPALVASFNPSLASTDRFSVSTSFAATRDGTLNGFVGWFSAELAPGVTLTNSPLAPAAMQRSQLFFPIVQPVALCKGDRVEFKMRSLMADSVVTWSSTVPGKGSSKHSTWNGMLLCKEDLRRSQPSFVPDLTQWGRAQLSVLSLCDGKRASVDISQEVFRNHSQLFNSLSDASAFVNHIVARYSK
jgi:hypothetical protein